MSITEDSYPKRTHGARRCQVISRSTSFLYSQVMSTQRRVYVYIHDSSILILANIIRLILRNDAHQLVLDSILNWVVVSIFSIFTTTWGNDQLRLIFFRRVEITN